MEQPYVELHFGRAAVVSHPAWPSLEWQTYSWDFETHGSFYGCRKACESLHVQMNPHDGQVLVVNTTRDALTHGRVIATYYTPAGKRLGRQRVVLEEIAANAVTPAMSARPTREPGLLHGAARTVCRWQAG